MIASCQGPVTVKHHSSTIVLESQYCLFVFCQMCHCALWPNISICHLVCPKEIVPKVLWFGKIQLSKPKLCCPVLFFPRSAQ